MKYIYLPGIIIFTIMVQTSCGSMNKAHGELHYNNNVTKGQELIDLKNALNKGALDQDEYDLMKDRIINDEYLKSFFRQLEDIDEEDMESVSI